MALLVAKLSDASVHVGVAHRHAVALGGLVEQLLADQEVQDGRTLLDRYRLTGTQLQQLDLRAKFAYPDDGDLVKPYGGCRAIDRL